MSDEKERNVINNGENKPLYLYTTKEAAVHLRSGINRVYEYIGREHDPLPSITKGRVILIPIKGLEAWLERQTSL